MRVLIVLILFVSNSLSAKPTACPYKELKDFKGETRLRKCRAYRAGAWTLTHCDRRINGADETPSRLTIQKKERRCVIDAFPDHAPLKIWFSEAPAAAIMVMGGVASVDTNLLYVNLGTCELKRFFKRFNDYPMPVEFSSTKPTLAVQAGCNCETTNPKLEPVCQCESAQVYDLDKSCAPTLSPQQSSDQTEADLKMRFEGRQEIAHPKSESHPLLLTSAQTRAKANVLFPTTPTGNGTTGTDTVDEIKKEFQMRKCALDDTFRAKLNQKVCDNGDSRYIDPYLLCVIDTPEPAKKDLKLLGKMLVCEPRDFLRRYNSVFNELSGMKRRPAEWAQKIREAFPPGLLADKAIAYDLKALEARVGDSP